MLTLTHGKEMRSDEVGPRTHGRVASELVEDVGQVAVLQLGRHERVLLNQRLDSAVLLAYLHLHGIAQRGALQLGHLGGHGRREHKGVAALAWDNGQDLVDFLLKVHVEQAIGLVEHQILERAQAEALGVLQVVHNASGRGHDDVRPLGQRDRLRHHVCQMPMEAKRMISQREVNTKSSRHCQNLDEKLTDTAHHGDTSKADGGAKSLELFRDLNGEFTEQFTENTSNNLEKST